MCVSMFMRTLVRVSVCVWWGLTHGCRRLLGRGAAPERTRTIYIGHKREVNVAAFCSNGVSTTKYSVVSFLPKFFFEQVRAHTIHARVRSSVCVCM
jgi:hypothetical protein